jgi:putative transposase
VANTYKQAYFHLVFTVKYRNALIAKSWREVLEKYITGIVQNNSHKLIAIYAMRDHIHILIGYNLNQTIPVLIENIKTSSNEFIKREKLCPYKFQWQNGYGAFSVSHTMVNRVYNYVMNQEEHHKKRSFQEEYMELLTMSGIDFKVEYLFEFFDNIDSDVGRQD